MLPAKVFPHIHRSHIVNLLRTVEVTDGMVRIAGALPYLRQVNRQASLPLSQGSEWGVYAEVECGVREI